MTSPSDQPLELPEEVFNRELESIEKRRACVGQPAPAPSAEPGPAVSRGLVGIALSGGGIRSSTFSLGVIQALHAKSELRRIDYMSTVSGGGYTGSMLSSLLNCSETRSDGFPLRKPVGQEEPPALSHLRNGSNYLNPGGLLNTLRLPAIVARGLLLNVLLALPYLMLAVLVTEALYEFCAPQVGPASLMLSQWSQALPPLWKYAVPLALLVGLYLAVAGVGMNLRNWRQRNRFEKRAALLLGLTLAGALLTAASSAVAWAIELPFYGDDGLEGLGRTYLHPSNTVWSGIAIGVIVLFAVIRATGNPSQIASRAALYLAGAAGPALLFCMYLLMLIAQADSPFIARPSWDLAGAHPPARSTGQTVQTFRTVFKLNERLRRLLSNKGVHYASTDALPALYSPQQRTWTLQRPVSRSGPGSVAHAKLGHQALPLESAALPIESLVDLGLMRFEVGDQLVTIVGAGLRIGGRGSDQTLMPDWLFAALTVCLWILNLAFLDVNRSSLHGFYRDRLSKLYLFRQHNGRLEATDDCTLSALNGTDSTAPYHLINTTLNLQGSQQRSLRGRQGDFFIFSKHFIGGPHTGYCPTAKVEHHDPHVNLGTAMAISAAAAAPNMGSTTVRPLVFVLTMLNLRLGYWLPNPVHVNSGMSRWTRPRSNYLWREAVGALTGSRPFVNVSDGGHLENLGVYELLRRRCALIIAVDGEADPAMSFGGLTTLMRLAKIDLGIDIHIDLAELQLKNNTRSGAHFAMGSIDYGVHGGEPKTGRIIYIKSSYVGDEGPIIARYKHDHPAFPHEPTADQFFDEEQFEAYRALGHLIGEQVIEHRALDRDGLRDSEKVRAKYSTSPK